MFLWRKKDGGSESKVYAWGIEIKSLFSVLVLKFEKDSREAYHNHAFNSNWILTFRGSWSKTWKEYNLKENKEITLTHGRKEI